MDWIDRSDHALLTTTREQATTRGKHRRRRTAASRRTQAWFTAAAFASGLATPGSATGSAATDRLLHGAAAGAVATAASTAPTWAVLVCSTGAAVLGWRTDGLGATAGVLALAVAVLLAITEKVDRHLLKAAAGALSTTALLRISDGSLSAAAAAIFLLTGLIIVTGFRNASRRTRRRVKVTVCSVVGLAGVSAALGAMAGLTARSALERSAGATGTALSAARSGDSPSAAASARAAAADLDDAHEALTAWWARPAWGLPFIGAHLRAGDEVARSAGPAVTAAAEAADALRLDALRPAEGRIDLDHLAAAELQLTQLRDDLQSARRGAKRARSAWLLRPLRERLESYDAQLASITSTTDLTLNTVQALPRLLGSEHPTRWFIAIGNPAESRDLGGCVCDYATVVAERGVLRLERSGGVVDIGAYVKGRTLAGVDLPQRYLAQQPEIFWQNLGGYPDLPTVATAARVLWDQVAPGSPIDGVAYIDPHGLAALLKLTGPVTAPQSLGQLTSENVAQLLLEDQYTRLPDQVGRKDALREAAALTFTAVASSRLPGPSALGAALGPAVQGGHLLATSFDAEGQRLLDRVRASGRFPKADGGDLASLRTSNLVENKQDARLRRSVHYKAVVDPGSRAVRATATIELRNDATPDLPDYVAANKQGLPKATNQLEVAWYSGLALERAQVNGGAVDVRSSSARGWWIHSLTVTIPPGDVATVVLDLAGRLVATNPYRLAVSPQAAVRDDHYAVEVSGGPGWTAAPVPVPPLGRRSDLVIPLQRR